MKEQYEWEKMCAEWFFTDEAGRAKLRANQESSEEEWIHANVANGIPEEAMRELLKEMKDNMHNFIIHGRMPDGSHAPHVCVGTGIFDQMKDIERHVTSRT